MDWCVPGWAILLWHRAFVHLPTGPQHAKANPIILTLAVLDFVRTVLRIPQMSGWGRSSSSEQATPLARETGDRDLFAADEG